MKRLFDLVLSAVLLIALSPLLLLLGLAVLLTSSGPALFRQTRVGRDFAPFTLLKFRTMTVSGTNDEMDFRGGRITGVGRFLRRTKLDELPQLWNIFVGHMSFVGPRPELPVYVEQFRSDFDELLRVRPGLTDPASLAFRNEESLLRESPDPDGTYIRDVLPRKIQLSREYLHTRTFVLDIAIIFRTTVGALRAPR